MCRQHYKYKYSGCINSIVCYWDCKVQRRGYSYREYMAPHACFYAHVWALSTANLYTYGTLWHAVTEPSSLHEALFDFEELAPHLADGNVLELAPSNLFYFTPSYGILWGGGGEGGCSVIPHVPTRPRSYVGVCHKNISTWWGESSPLPRRIGAS